MYICERKERVRKDMSEGVVTNETTGNQHYEAYLEANSDKQVLYTTSEHLHGRTKILVDDTEITDANILNVLVRAIGIHAKNRGEIEYLYNYRRGIQPSLQRTKQVRPDIVAHIVENRADQIVDFRTGYMCGSAKAIQYVGSCSDGRQEELAELVSKLNEYMDDVDAPTENKELFDWVFTCGQGYKMALPNVHAEYGDTHTTPFESYVLDPRNTFVVYSNELGEPPILGVRYVVKEDGQIVYSCYTSDTVYTVVQFEVKGKKKYRIDNVQGHIVNSIPIIEYIDNTMRVGAFETVITLLDSINECACNRVEAVEQFVQALLVMHNVALTNEDMQSLVEQGCIQFDDATPDKTGEVKYISLDLNQTNTQTLVDSMWRSVREICGIPSVSDGNTSDSSNNGAVMLRQGWGQAEAKAKNSEEMFKVSERKFLKLVLGLCRDNSGTLKNLHPQDIQIRFTRRNYEDIQTKSQVLVTLLNNEKIDPKLAFEHSGMFVDPERAYLQSMQYAESNQKKALELAQKQSNSNDLGNDEEDIIQDNNPSNSSEKGTQNEG